MTSSKTIYYSWDLSTSRYHATICRLDLSWNKKPNSLTSCSAYFISIEGSSVRLGYSRNIPHIVLQCLLQLVNTSSIGEILIYSWSTPGLMVRSYSTAGQHQLLRWDPCLQLVNTSSIGEILIYSWSTPALTVTSLSRAGQHKLYRWDTYQQLVNTSFFRRDTYLQLVNTSSIGEILIYSWSTPALTVRSMSTAGQHYMCKWFRLPCYRKKGPLKCVFHVLRICFGWDASLQLVSTSSNGEILIYSWSTPALTVRSLSTAGQHQL